MRRFQIEDKKVLDILNEKEVIGKDQIRISAEMEALEKQFNENMARYKRIDEKARPLIKKIYSKIEMSEFEEVSRVHQDEKDMSWWIEVADRLQEWKLSWANRFDNKEKKIK
jgi:hypothetical protein